MWRMTGRTPSMLAHEAWPKALSIFAVTMILVSLASAALALSESPAAGSSAAASGSPAPSAEAPSSPPATKLVPSDESEPGAPPSEAGAAGAPSAAAKPRKHHHVVAKPPEVEPATARLKVTRDGWIYAGPSKNSQKIEKLTVGKFVNVSGSTRYYLQASLKNGQTGYIVPADVELVKPTDKIFVLTQDAAVLEAPNHWSKKLAEVHRSRDVHVIGLALNYMQIRMKSGLTGFIPVTALQ
jgi:hypothetical protein